jgi:hypothetical protein
MLQPSHRRLRSWWLTGTAGLLSLTVVMAGVGLRAGAQESPKKDAPKKEEPDKIVPKKGSAPRTEVPAAPDFDDLLRNLPQGVDPQQMQRMQQQMRRMMEQMRNQFPQAGFQGMGGAFGRGREMRLGARVDQPSAVLTDQLDLPKGQGMVIEDVVSDSAAAKAGIKSHDILLELNGKPVPSDPREFMKEVHELKADTPMEAVVLRKGKRETIKGLSLPEARAGAEFGFPQGGFQGFQGRAVAPAPPQLPGFQAGGAPANPFPGGAGFPGGPGFQAAPGGARGGVMTTIFRSGDRFTGRHQEGSLVITVTGTVSGGKAAVRGIQVQDGRETNRYESVDKVPEEYRDKVKELVQMSEKGAAKVDIKEP